MTNAAYNSIVGTVISMMTMHKKKGQEYVQITPLQLQEILVIAIIIFYLQICNSGLRHKLRNP